MIPWKKRPWLSIAVFGTALAACSDTGGGAADTGPDASPDAAGDAGQADAGPDGGDAPVFVPNESEPNDNDAPQDIVLPMTIRGRIGEPSVHPELGSIPDADFFRFAATAGTVVRLTLGAHTLDPDISVETEDQGAAAIRRRLHPDAPGATRQLFIPTTGSYVVIVADARNAGVDEHVGGDAYTYELTVAIETVTAEPVSLPLAQTGESIPAGNGVRIFAVAVSEAGVFLADTDAVDWGTDLDTALVLMDGDMSDAVALNDDEAVQSGLYDAALSAEVEAGSYHLVLDHAMTLGADTTYDLTARVLDPAVEGEPNNTADQAWLLPIGAEDGDSVAVTGTIEAPGSGEAGDVPDFDWFALGLVETGDTVVITVSAPEGSDLVPTLEAGTPDPFFGDVYARTVADSGGTARFEMTAIGVGGQPYYAVVGDARNVGADGAPLEAVGGATYTYTITAQAFTRSQSDLGTTPASAPGQTLDPTGHVGWYTFTADESGTLRVAVENANFEPTFWLLEHSTGAAPEEIGSLGERGRESIEVEVNAATPFQLAVFNEGAWPAGATATFDLVAEIVD